MYTTVGAYKDLRSAEELEKSVTWNQAGNVELFREKYRNWHPIIKKLTDLTPDVRLFPNYAGSALSTWLPAPRVALLGDAAHTHGGAFAAGGSLALNDALALGLALRHVVQSRKGTAPLQLSEVQYAFALYDETRRPHATKLLNIVHGSLHKKAPTYTSAEAEDEALIARMKGRPDLTWLSEHDVEKAFANTVEAFQKVGRQLSPGSKTLTDAYESRL